MAKGTKHYFADGREYTGGTHKMPNGETHSGSMHTKNSKKLFHFKDLSEKAKKKGIKSVLFDRSGYRYHGRIKSFADGAREGGLKF